MGGEGEFCLMFKPNSTQLGYIISLSLRSDIANGLAYLHFCSLNAERDAEKDREKLKSKCI